jgi:hypothetical protein
VFEFRFAFASIPWCRGRSFELGKVGRARRKAEEGHGGVMRPLTSVILVSWKSKIAFKRPDVLDSVATNLGALATMTFIE